MARTGDLQAAAPSGDFGVITAMTRGDLRWAIALPARGGLRHDGVAPLLIQWQGEPPATRLEDRGCALLALDGWHPRAGLIQSELHALGFQDAFQLVPDPKPRLVARLRTRTGLHTLCSSES